MIKDKYNCNMDPCEDPCKIYPFKGIDFTAEEINSLLKSIQNKVDRGEVQDGLSAYKIAVANGYQGTEEQWLASLRGPRGNAMTFQDLTPEQIGELQSPATQAAENLNKESQAVIEGVKKDTQEAVDNANKAAELAETNSKIQWYPTVASNGDLSWSRNPTVTPPAKVNIKGPAGRDGLSGSTDDIIVVKDFNGEGSEGTKSYVLGAEVGPEIKENIEETKRLDKNDIAYRVSQFHQHTGFWEVVPYDSGAQTYLEASTYNKGDKVNVPNVPGKSFQAVKSLQGVMPDVNTISNKFTLEEAIYFVPDAYKTVGMEISFIDSTSNQPVVYRYKGGNFLDIISWLSDVYEKFSELAVIENERGYGNTFMGISLPEEYPYYIGAVILDNSYNLEDQPVFRLTGGDVNDVTTHLDEVYSVGDKYVRVVIMSAKANSITGDGSTRYPNKMYFYGSEDKVFKFHISDLKAWAIDDITEDDFTNIVESIKTYVKREQALTSSIFSLGVLTADRVKGTDNILDDIIKKLNIPPVPGIVCWGSSSTAGGGWVNKLSTLTGLKTFNGGIGGENLWTILGRIGSEPMRLKQSITIPADTTPVQLGSGTGSSSSILYVRGHKVTPLLQGDGLLNPVIIDRIEGTLKWTGSSYNDPSGYYTFTRSVAGEERTTLPDEIVFSYGSRTMRNCIQILLLGYNQGYSSVEEYVEMVKRAKEFAYNGMCLIVGRHAAADKEAADKIIAEEVEFKKEFGMMFVSSREYMIQVSQVQLAGFNL